MIAMRKPVVPRSEPEAIEAEVRMKWRGDHETVATTPIRLMEVDGVSTTSRYNKADESDSMVGMVNGVDEGLRPPIKSIFCDSKACACYSVEVRPCSTPEAQTARYRGTDVALLNTLRAATQERATTRFASPSAIS